jgi:IclR family pca regulon transcriptional regulator
VHPIRSGCPDRRFDPLAKAQADRIVERNRMQKFEPPEEKSDFLQSLAKGLAVIQSFGPDYPEMTLTTIAKRVGLSPGSTRRALLTLTKLGYLGFRDQRYHLAARTLQLGYSYLTSLSIVGLIQPRLSALTEKLNESTSISVLDGHEIVCIARTTARRLERDYMSVGTRYPAHATSSGKVLLGELTDDELKALYDPATPLQAFTPFTVTDPKLLYEHVREGKERGFVYVSQETALGMDSLAVPITFDGEMHYVLTVSGDPNFHGPNISELYLADVLATAKSISEALSAKG